MRQRYTDEFKIEAVKQVTENGYNVSETARRLGVHPDSLKAWIKKFKSPEAMVASSKDQSAQALTERTQKGNRGAGYPKKGRRVLCQQPRLKYAFIKEYTGTYRVRRMCKV